MNKEELTESLKKSEYYSLDVLLKYKRMIDPFCSTSIIIGRIPVEYKDNDKVEGCFYDKEHQQWVTIINNEDKVFKND